MPDTEPRPHINGPAPAAESRPVAPNSPEMEMFRREVEGLVRELNARWRMLKSSDITPAGFVGLFNRAIGKRLPSPASDLLEDVQRNLDGATFIDFADPEVARGMALLTYYSVRSQAEALREPLGERMQQLYGYELLDELRHNLDGTTLKDLTDPDTWAGIWYMLSYSARAQLVELLRKYEED